MTEYNYISETEKTRLFALVQDAYDDYKQFLTENNLNLSNLLSVNDNTYSKFYELLCFINAQKCDRANELALNDINNH